MAVTVVISCPQCKKQMKVPANYQGKKVKCADCGHPFKVTLPSGIQTKPGAPGKKAPGAPAKPGAPARAGEEEEDDKPYQLTHLDEIARCPHCAKEMESPEAVICLHCGFNVRTRTHLETKKTVEATGGEQFMWLLPGILCVLAALFMGSHAIYLVVQRIMSGAPGAFMWIWDMTFGEVSDDNRAIFRNTVDCCVIWWLIIYGFGIYKCTRFAIKRLIQQPTKPEEVKEE